MKKGRTGLTDWRKHGGSAGRRYARGAMKKEAQHTGEGLKGKGLRLPRWRDGKAKGPAVPAPFS